MFCKGKKKDLANVKNNSLYKSFWRQLRSKDKIYIRQTTVYIVKAPWGSFKAIEARLADFYNFYGFA